MSDVDFWFVEEAQVKPYTGGGAFGDRWGAQISVDCWIEEGSHLIRDPEGREITSSTVLAAALTDRDNLAVGSRVTLPSGRTSTVLLLDVANSGALELGLDHVEAHLA